MIKGTNYTRLDNLFKAQDRKKAQLKASQKTTESYADAIKCLDLEISNLAADYVLKVVANPNNKKRGNKPVIQYHEIERRVLQKEYRFTEDQIRQGLKNLLHTGAIESERIEIRSYPGIMQMVIYSLKENKK